VWRRRSGDTVPGGETMKKLMLDLDQLEVDAFEVTFPVRVS
jgi:hypothetical protein